MEFVSHGAGGQRGGEGPDGDGQACGRAGAGQEHQVSKGGGRGKDSLAPDCQIITTRLKRRGSGAAGTPPRALNLVFWASVSPGAQWDPCL